MKLRDYQIELIQKIKDTDFFINPLVQLDTGAGKSLIIAELASFYRDVYIVAHRNCIIMQLATLFRSQNISYDLLANHFIKKRFKHDSNSSIKIASIDTLISLKKRGFVIEPKYFIYDEAHHLLKDNKFGCILTDSAKVVGFTATPIRLDKESLKRGQNTNGVFDILLQSDGLVKNSIATLIQRRYLSKYKAYGVSLKLWRKIKNIKQIKGDYSLREASVIIKNCEFLVSDAIKEYKIHCLNRRCLVFCASILNANDLAIEFRKAGITAASIHSKLSPLVIEQILQDFKNNVIQCLCSVEMVGEGFDCADVDAIILQRPTASMTLHRQQIGRVLRYRDDKTAVIIDQVGNLLRHGLPCDEKKWQLDEEDSAKFYTNLVICENCGEYRKFTEKVCKNCLHNSALTSTYIDYEYIDVKLVELEKAEIKRIALQEIKENTIIYPEFAGSRVLNSVLYSIMRHVICTTKQEFTAQELNYFLSNCDRSFWINNFCKDDLKTKNVKKFKKIIKNAINKIN